MKKHIEQQQLLKMWGLFKSGMINLCISMLNTLADRSSQIVHCQFLGPQSVAKLPVVKAKLPLGNAVPLIGG
jgi:hypothetical protein